MRTPTAPLLLGIVALCLVASTVAHAAGALEPDYLRCQWRRDPLGIGSTEPRLSWIVTSKQRDQVQTAYRILVASDAEQLDNDNGDLWDSGMVTSDQTSRVVYAGKPLTSGMQCFWKVRVWDKDHEPSSWSEPALWTMGLLGSEAWKAQWIGFDASRERPTAQQLSFDEANWIWYPEGDATAGVPVARRYFRKEVTIPANREIATAYCAATGDDNYTIYVNGQRIDGGNSWKQAGAIDVKEYLRPGKNAIALEAANGGEGPNAAGAIVKLRIQYADGGTTIVCTDGSWRTAKSAPDGWREIDFDAGGWEHAKVAAAYGAGPWGKEVTIGTKTLFLPPAQLLRTRFIADKPIERATVYASALGDYELYVNGRPVSDTYFTPGWTEYKVRVYYNTYDVTERIKEGFNAIGAVLGDGWYSGHIGWGRIRDHYGKNTRFSAQLTIEYEDGTTKTVMTDEDWKANTGPILEGDFLMGETYDARAEIPDWCGAEFDDAQWSDVDVTEKLSIAIQAYPGVPVTEFQEIEPVSVSEPTSGAFVYDMGTNFAGFVRLKVSGAEAGQKIVLRFAERLNPDGTVYTTNLRGARAIDTYICKGQGTETWQPRFTFHGFQYVEVTGYPGTPGKDAITGIELTSATPVAGQFKCSDGMANTLYHNICQTQRANFIEVPTDCPQRDERLGWMGDAQIYVRTATYNSDVAAFFNKWLVDVEDAQLPNGAFSDVAPRIVANGGGTAAWGDAGVICPWTIYQVYGDTRVLSEHYDAMEEWIAYCQETSKGLLRPASGYGDWLSIKADTPKDVLATAYFAYSTKLVAKTAEVLGKNNDARKYEELFNEIKRAFNRAYVGRNGRIKGNTQTVYVLALAFDLLPEKLRPVVTQYLVDDIRSRNWHLSTGFVGTKDLMATLSRFGQTDVAYHLFHNKTFPSWGFSIQHGATSIWERWDGWTPEKGFQDAGMNSFAHYSFGAVAEWMFKTIGGIDTDGPAYKDIIIRPRPGGRLSWAKVGYDSVRGPIATAWKIEEVDGAKVLTLDVTIPANTTAKVYVPTTDPAQVKVGKDLAMASEDATFVGTEEGAAILEIGSGDYTFTAPLPE